MLYKYKEGKKHEVIPGYSVEKKPLLKLAEEFKKEGTSLYILDDKGEDIREVDIKENPIFILGDYEGLPSKELRRLKTMATPVSVGKRTYFASQTMIIVNNELDRREDSGKL
jgi:tRNA (pseudouridine54-N1)-methyltransferase